MTSGRPSIFRDALQVSPERIALLSDAQLNSLMRNLLCSQAYRCGAAISQVLVNTIGQAKDDGADGWSPKPASDDSWLGAAATCWQFKAGSAGEAARLSGEVAKRIPRETLAAGGRFVVIASGSTNGKKGEEDRLERLRTEATTVGLPEEAIEVLGSERLAVWCNQHPALAARWAGRPEGLWRLEDWLTSDEHQVPWQATAAVQQQIADRRRDLDFLAGSLRHLHVEGPPGVGKTRFTLELCRDADWRGAVVYVPQASELGLLELIDGATADEGVQLIVVADEVQAAQIRLLRNSLDRGRGRVRLISIGHSKTPDPTHIPALSVSPLDRVPMAAVISGWHPSMPPEHVAFVVRFADGYVRLARLAADAVIRDPSVDVYTLLDLHHIRGFLDGMLGTGVRRALHVVAVLANVGWTDDRQLEGKAVADHLGLDWNEVRANVDDYHRRLGIVPRGGRYRYVSPTPLGNYLAVDAWTSFPELLRSLPGVLPTEEARDAYYERLQSIASSPQARQFARDELALFFRVEDFLDARAVRRWSAFSAADPELAARQICRALSTAEPEARAQIADRARREAVWTLVRLGWKSSAFRDSVMALALLAEAENETWGNNATSEFLTKFQVVLGGTATPYANRLEILDGLLALGRPTLVRLVVKALARAAESHETRVETEPPSDSVPEPEWHPQTRRDVVACISLAISKLTAIAKSRHPDAREELVEAAHSLCRLLGEAPVRPSIVEYLEALRAACPDTRESLRRYIAKEIRIDRKFRKDIPAGDVSEIEALHAAFEDSSLSGRLHQHVGPNSWESEGQIDLTELARALIRQRDVLVAEWPWLTSGDAAGAWRLGEALATVDGPADLEGVLPTLEGRGRDLRVLCGYISKRREQQRGWDWFDDWMASHLSRSPSDMPLLFEVTWRCGATVRTAHLVADALRQREVDIHVAGQLGLGRWDEGLPVESLAEIIESLFDGGHRETAIEILDHRLRSKPGEAPRWEELALSLVTSSELIRGKDRPGYCWSEVARGLVARHAQRIAAAIFREQADRASGRWFAEYGEANEILRQCVEVDPVGVWNELAPHLLTPAEAYAFSIGFPRGLLERMPAEEVGRWVSEKPEERAAVLARLVSMNLTSDDTLASRLLGQFGDVEDVGSAFFSSYASGSWSGPASAHWAVLAAGLEEAAKRTALPKLRTWAQNEARSLRQMADRDRQREEEDDLRRG